MTALDPMAAALQVERFIASCKVNGENGALWRRTDAADSKTPRTFYHGSAGVALFYIELHRATGDNGYLAEATSAGEELLAYVARKDQLTIGFYSGWPGFVFVLNELFKASDDLRFKAGATLCLEKMMAQSEPIGGGVGWIEPMPFSDITGKTGDREVIDLSVGAAGAGVILLYAHREGLHAKALHWARQTADRLLEVAEQTEDGPRWLMMTDMPFPFTAPNFAHGGAGVAYFLADLATVNEDSTAGGFAGNTTYIDVAIAAARYVQSRSVPQDQGHLVCHNEEEQPPSLFYLGVCHGPAGTGRLMYLLHQITGDSRWLDWLHDNMQGLLGTGVPEVRTSGLWQNYGQCCGDAGIGDYALSLYSTTGRADYLKLAERIAVTALANASNIRDGIGWAQAEHRSRPDFLETQTGYMQGAAGLGSFLLHLATHEQATPAKIALPETPFATA